MKSYFNWILVFILLLMVVMPMLLKGPDGRPIMGVNDWMPASGKLGQVVDQLKEVSDQARDHVGLTSDQFSNASPEPDAGTPQLSSQQLEDSPTLLSSSSGKMYKWQDENGKWHFSSQKPLAVTRVSVEDLPDIENVINASVIRGGKSSTIGAPGLGDGGDLLKKVQRMTEARND